MRFQNKVAVITGSGLGIGEGIAEEFGKEGATVVIAEINVHNGQRVEKRLRGMGIQAKFIHTDVSSEASVAAAVSEIAASLPGIDILINNAGVRLPKSLLDTSSEEWDQVLGVHLKGVFLMSKHCAPLLRHSTVRSIVNIASVHALETSPNLDAYAAAKGGVVSFTRSSALSLKDWRIRVNCICPGYIETPQFRQLVLDKLEDPDEQMAQMISFHPTDRIGNQTDIGRVCMFLSSEDAAFVNGHIMVVDGGVTAQLMC